MMGNYLDKWKTLFPEVVGGTKRPLEAISDQDEFNTNGFPQFIAQDPVRYDLQNAFLKQFLSNDAWLWARQQQADQALDRHKDDARAHPNGVSGNAASSTKLQTARSLNLGGAVTADAATFDGTENATINVKTLDATKLKGTASVSTTGNAATATKVVTTAATGASANIAEASMGGSDSARIRVSGAESAGELALETADDGNEAIVARQYTGPYSNVLRTAFILDKNGNTSFPGTVVAPNFTGSLNGNAATATNADKVDGIHAASLFYNKGIWDANNWATIGTYQVNSNPPTSDAYGWGQVLSSSTVNARFQLYASDHFFDCNGRLHYRTGWDDSKHSWNTILDSENYNLFVPTKTGGGASGMWGINISGNAVNDGNGDNIANTYLKKATVIDVIYPVGSIYMSMSATNPADLFGVGTWKRISQGRMLLGADDSTYKAGATGGEATHTLTAAEMPAHSHTGTTSTNGNHTHQVSRNMDLSNADPTNEGGSRDTICNYDGGTNFKTSTAGNHNHTFTTGNSGGGAAHNNMSPYLVCYIWQRTA